MFILKVLTDTFSVSLDYKRSWWKARQLRSQKERRLDLVREQFLKRVVSQGRVDCGARRGEYRAYLGLRNRQERTNNHGIELRSA